MGVYEALGVRRVVNACGIYTDLGGSVLSSSVWAAAAEADATWASLPELLDGAGARVAAVCGCEAARLVPVPPSPAARAGGRGADRGRRGVFELSPVGVGALVDRG
jgi:D-glucosaminate-6-phosphate ammonia-lyase